MDNVNRLEALFAKKYGGRAVKNSGRGMNKGDAIISGLLVDTKFTDSKSYSLNVEAFNKHAKDAFRSGLIPCVIPVFQQYNEQALAIVPLETLLELLEKNAN